MSAALLMRCRVPGFPKWTHGRWGRSPWAEVYLQRPSGIRTVGDEASQLALGKNYTCWVRAEVLECDGTNPSVIAAGTHWAWPVPASLSVAEVLASAEFACVRETELRVWCWGRNTEGQVGAGLGAGQVPEPAIVGGFREGKNATHTFIVATLHQLSLGFRHSCGIEEPSDPEGGFLWCWGHNLFDVMLNRSIGTRVASPVLVLDPRVVGGWTLVAAGLFQTFGVANGTLWAWGHASGLGGDRPMHPEGANRITLPAPPISLSSWDGTTCAVDLDLRVFCWGNANAGQLGDRRLYPAPQQPTLVAMPPGVFVRSIAVGGAHVCAHSPGEHVVCWGRNADGEAVPSSLGLGFTTGPAEVVQAYGAVHLQAKFHATIAGPLKTPKTRV